MPAIDDYESFSTGLESPVRHAVAVVPNDGSDLPRLTRAVHLGGGGNLKCTMAGGEIVTFRGLATGWHPIRTSRIWADETTAADIIGCW